MTSASTRQMNAYYSGRAPYYDAVYEKPERKRDIEFLKLFLAQRLHGREVIEVACGTGYWSRFIAPGCSRFVAIDALPEPLELARQRPGIDPAQLHIADAYALPSSLGEFDGAFAGLWLSHVPIERRGEFFASLHALLRPKSLVVLIDNSPVQCREFPIVETDESGNTYQERPLRDGSRHRVLKNFPTEGELSSLAGSFGAERFEYRALENFWYFEYELADSR